MRRAAVEAGRASADAPPQRPLSDGPCEPTGQEWAAVAGPRMHVLGPSVAAPGRSDRPGGRLVRGRSGHPLGPDRGDRLTPTAAALASMPS
jgi:hypothetical protein